MKFPYIINRIGFGGGEGTSLNGGTISHNQLEGKQGGTQNEYFHLSEGDYNQLKNLLFKAPTLELSPNNIGAIREVGDSLITTAIINIIIGNAGNVYQNKLNIDSMDYLLPKSNYALSINTSYNTRGNKILSTVFIRRSDNQAQIIKYVTAPWEYKLFWFTEPANNDLFNIESYLDQDLTTHIRSKNGGLRSSKAIGNYTFSPTSPAHVYVAYPISYGQAEIASQSFPNSNVARSNRDFQYNNNNVITPYRLTKMNDPIGGEYYAIIK